jgi:hypothetical protein
VFTTLLRSVRTMLGYRGQASEVVRGRNRFMQGIGRRAGKMLGWIFKPAAETQCPAAGRGVNLPGWDEWRMGC